jgi:hypothetical protein
MGLGITVANGIKMADETVSVRTGNRFRRVRIFIICFLASMALLFFESGNAAILVQASVCDEKGVSIAYVNIGFLGMGVGTVSDGDGCFSLSAPDSLSNHLLTFSHIGYKVRQTPLDEVRGGGLVVLTEKATELPGVFVISGKAFSKELKRTGLKIPKGYLEITGTGGEGGIVLKIAKPSLIKQVKFGVQACTYDSVRVRVNISYADSLAQAIKGSLLHVPVYQTIGKSAKKREYVVPVSEQVLVEKGEIFLSLEFVQYDGSGHVRFPVYTGSCYLRDVSLGNLQKIPVSFEISLLVTQFK